MPSASRMAESEVSNALAPLLPGGLVVPACAALWVGGTKGDVTSCVFEANSAALSGGALHLSDGAHVSAAANQYRSNQAKAVGGWATGEEGGR